jgi:BioD-like phosphotransacetylase family protein
MRMRRDGLKVGYMKPVNVAAMPGPEGPTDEDVAFIKGAFDLPEPFDVLSPVALTASKTEQLLRGQDITNYETKLRSAYEQVHKGRDVIILEGGTTLREGYMVGLSTPRVAELLNARTLVVIRWDESRLVDDALASRTRLGEAMMGILINMVPQNKIRYAEEVITPYLDRHQVPVFGIFRQEKLLQAASVMELAEGLDANILTCANNCDSLVESVAVGAMNVDSALSYFRRMANKAVITGGDRVDIQLAALETSTRCLILTGNIMPNPMILTRADDAGVPVLLCRHDTLSAVEVVNQYFGHSRFQQRPKIERFATMMEQYMNFARLYQALGIQIGG